MSTCATCKHALPIDPNGHWRDKYGYSWADTHIHCAHDVKPFVHVIIKCSSCTWEPSKWEASDAS